MNFKTIRVTACGLAAVLAFSGMSLTAEAAGNSSILPSGGVNLALSRGNSLSNVATDTVMPIEAIIEWATAEEAGIIIPEAEPTEEDLFRNLVIAQVTNYVNVRSLPSEEGEIVGKLYNNSVGTFISEENGWYQITSGSVTGYVKGEFCVTGEDAVELARKVGTRLATVTTTTLKVRKEPSLEASVLGLVPLDDELVVLEETEGWVKVDVEEGIGWISTDYATLHTEFVQAESREEEAARLAKEAEERRRAREAAAAKAAQAAQSAPASSVSAQTYVVSGDSEMGSAVAEYALQFVGNPYVYGGSSLTNGTDCSGFVMSVYANFGVSLPHSSSADRSQGAAVDGLSNAQPGDIICYSGHVGLYIGNGQIVHASNSRTGIIVSSADYRKILAVRRIF
ncbi:MAG: C40 family peptidase [Eubacterium sp.]|nr:C40 family peptidase [Eubacterium sp.]MCM1214215.1 C40 family peptidase [Lachnospiraceae bacterium]MCM1302626.1 C40 family peptidase [Butyrivibrio sp.]MCM1342245.1 C40 family peptidase [Muribaculaceae bacterium]MCM1238125.1 C40 family peptidase [Lachnospiraceae bacterium]